MAETKAALGVYIDGFNLYHAIDKLRRPALKWLSLHALAKSFVGPTEELGQIRYFTAIQNNVPVKADRHRQFIEAQKAYGVDVQLSRFQKTMKICSTRGGGCAFQEEKQTDVKLCAAVLTDAYTGSVTRFVLVTADSDQVPTVEALRAMGRHVTIAAPPGRKDVARELGSKADAVLEITEGRLGACLLPRSVYAPRDGKFIAACPATYVG